MQLTANGAVGHARNAMYKYEYRGRILMFCVFLLHEAQ